MKKILVSTCLLGQPVRYNGSDKPTDTAIIEKWRREGRLVAICPELAAGFTTPRPPAEIRGGQGNGVLLGTAQVLEAGGRDVSQLYCDGARRALELAFAQGVAVALLTEGSPSCGSTFIYSGDFSGHTKAGRGVTAELLEQHGIRVFADGEIADADRFLEQLDSPPIP